jgi:hypothetical protein
MTVAVSPRLWMKLLRIILQVPSRHRPEMNNNVKKVEMNLATILRSTNLISSASGHESAPAIFLE